MASSPETTPTNKTSINPPSNESSKESSEKSKNASPPSSSPSTHPSPPPKSPPPPPAPKSPLASPPQSSPPKSSPPPPKESPSSPPPQSPRQQSQSPSSPPPPHSTTPSQPPPAATTTPPPNSTATPLGVFAPPPPLGASLLSPPSTSPRNESSPNSREKSPSSNNSGSKSSPLADTSSTANIAIIAGITSASVLLLALVILIAACMLKKKRKPYYHGPPKGDPYYTSPTQWHSPQGHIVHIAPPPGVMGTPIGGGGGWAAQPHIGADGGWAAAQPHMSSEFSSGYSGNGPAHTLKQAHTPMQAQSPNVGLGLSKSQFSYDELAAATGGFSQANLLGQGGFGYVHLGVLPNGQTVAVKSLKTGSGQGEREFQAEVEIISRVHHRHLVSLVGYCIADGQRMLVYEFVPNKTMEFHLHGKGRSVMDWATRLRIALGSAKGLAYLHEDCHPKIIHRDIKAANILLDDKFEAMVADFGLAKLSADNNTHVSTRVMGTFGYLAPEYASSGKLTEKSDVFSFGVMLLELITGRKPVDPNHNFMEDSLVDWARPLLSKAIDDGNYKALVDPRLEDNFAIDEMARMVACASACIRHSARRRPKMTRIARALDGDSSLDDLEGGKAGQGTSSSGSSRSYDTGTYNADMMKFRQMVMSSQEFLSSEYGGGTNEYAPSSTSGDSRDAGIHSGAERQKM